MISRSVRGERHSITAQILNNLGRILYEQGDLVAPENRLELLAATSVTNEFLNRPDMISHIRRHRGRPR